MKWQTLALIGGALLAGVIVGWNKIRAYRNKNPGNIRYTPQQKLNGATGADSGNYAIYPSAAIGYKALFMNLHYYQYTLGLKTLRDLGLKWAPPADNGGATDYGAKLARQLGLSQDAVVQFYSNGAFAVALAKAITKNESGVLFWSDYTINQGYLLARDFYE